MNTLHIPFLSHYFRTLVCLGNRKRKQEDYTAHLGAPLPGHHRPRLYPQDTFPAHRGREPPVICVLCVYCMYITASHVLEFMQS